jgi:hypothetical protein
VARAFLSLNVPKPGLAGWPVAASTNPRLLWQFKQAVLADWEQRANEAVTELEAMLCRLEQEKLRAILDLLIPGDLDGNIHEA